MPSDDQHLEELVRSMYRSGEAAPWDLTPEELRSKAHRSRIRIPDAKFLVLVAAAAVLIVVGFAVTGRSKPHSPSVIKPTTTTSTVSRAGSVVVPNVVGLGQASATNTVGEAGLSAGTVTLLPSSQYPAGTVISQNPRPDASARPGTSVNLVVSSGPSSTPKTVPLTAFIGSWSTHDGSIVINGDGTGQLEWPGATPPEGVPQTAQITVSATSASQATVTVTSGSLVFVNNTTGKAEQTYGPGSTFTLTTTPFGLDLTEDGQHLYYFCTSAERQAGQDQQYCGA